MARKTSSVLSIDESLPRKQRKPWSGGTRLWLIAALILAVLGLAWFDGGAEPIHPITENIPVPEGR